MNNVLSKRGEIACDWEDIFHKNLFICNSNSFHETHNPEGYINHATAVNFLCDDIIGPKLDNHWICDFHFLGYKDSNIGTMRFRNAISKMMTEFLECYEPVLPDNLFCFPGVTSCIDMLCHCIANPGEVFLVPTPMHSRTFKNCMQRSNVDIFPIYVIDESENENACLTMEKIIDAYKCATMADNVVRGILLTNPNCPLGDVYSQEFLKNVMKFCNDKNIHLIVNEVYALSTFSTSENFHSILKFSRISNPNTTHIVYGLSKDFGIAGLRIGVIHTKCTELQNVLKKQSAVNTIPYPLLEIAAAVLEDLKWCRYYIEEYQRRLTEYYTICVAFLHDIGVKVKKSSAGFFLWIDLRGLCGSSFDGERDFTNFLLDKFHLFIGPGEEDFCVQPGWFRMAFSRKPHQITNGLNRLKEGLKIYQSYKRQKSITVESPAHDLDSD